MSTPAITITELNPDTGSVLNNVSALSFGRVTKGTHSRVKVFTITFSNVTKAGNLKIGLIVDAGIIVNPQVGTLYSDGSTNTGNFGIMSSVTFTSSMASSPLSRHFAGVNGDSMAGNSNNVSIGMNSDTTSYYIYLDVAAGSGVGAGNGAYKIFFDYA
jgi:hypothetical protein